MQAPEIEKSVLTIAGSDSCGGSGIQADMNTFAAFGVYGASVVTAVTARNTLDTQAVEPMSDRIIVDQIESVLADLPICAIKTGMLPSIPGIAVLGEILAQQKPHIPMVVDPVVIEPAGMELSGEMTLQAVRNHLFPLATVITPNREEAQVLTGMAIRNMKDMESGSHRLCAGLSQKQPGARQRAPGVARSHPCCFQSIRSIIASVNVPVVPEPPRSGVVRSAELIADVMAR
jgi:hydroxymethylpyrimidine/phosphomethylpyrimidine kinase